MTELIVRQDITGLLDSWLQAERNGLEFPVPFDLAWQMAGYATKASAKRALKDLREGVEFSTQMLKRAAKGASGVQQVENINFSLRGVKEFCLLARTPEGKAIRLYFIDAEEKWQLVQQTKPEIASEIEVLHLKLEIAKQEAIAKSAEEKTIGLRHYVVTALPKPVADRILGVTSVTEVEYRDRVIKDNQVINDGSTINKAELCQRYGFINKEGKADYRRLKRQLDAIDTPSSAWEEVDTVITNHTFKRSHLSELDRAIYTAEQRQMFLGENQ